MDHINMRPRQRLGGFRRGRSHRRSRRWVADAHHAEPNDTIFLVLISTSKQRSRVKVWRQLQYTGSPGTSPEHEAWYFVELPLRGGKWSQKRGGFGWTQYCTSWRQSCLRYHSTTLGMPDGPSLGEPTYNTNAVVNFPSLQCPVMSSFTAVSMEFGRSKMRDDFVNHHYILLS